MNTGWRLPWGTGAVLAAVAAAAGGEKPLELRAREGLGRAVRYFRKEISTQGSYLWSYSLDRKTRRGEVAATETQGWVQPPGTPAVGLAYLAAYEATRDATYLEAAREAAHALARKQLASGGWDYVLEFDPEKSRQWYYRSDAEAGDREPGKRRNVSTYDDNNSQSALRLLMRLDQAVGGKDAEVRTAVEYGLKKLLEAQYPNGAWPQRYNGLPRNPAEYPVLKAHYPERWPRTYPGARYTEYYTFNDGAIRDIILVFLEAHRRYGKPEYLQAARKGGEFILLAQMPDPQPAWAQQYNLRMEPAWARKFEPPSVVSGESVGVVRTLLDLYLYTGEEKFLKPVGPALEWLKRSRLPGPEGSPRWARFYELQTNRPLYFTQKYELVYTDTDLPTHYSFQNEYGVPGVIAQYDRMQREGREKLRAAEQRVPTAAERRNTAESLAPRVTAILAALDAEGRWTDGDQIRSDTFVKNVDLLAKYLAASRE